MSLLIKNGRIITDESDFVADVFVERDKVTSIGNALPNVAEKVIDAGGSYLIPGGVDVHTHMDLPFGSISSSDDFETGTIAAAHGGHDQLPDRPADRVSGSWIPDQDRTGA